MPLVEQEVLAFQGIIYYGVPPEVRYCNSQRTWPTTFHYVNMQLGLGLGVGFELGLEYGLGLGLGLANPTGAPGFVDTRSLVLYVTFLFWPLCCLFILDLRLLIIYGEV